MCSPVSSHGSSRLEAAGAVGPAVAAQQGAKSFSLSSSTAALNQSRENGMMRISAGRAGPMSMHNNTERDSGAAWAAAMTQIKYSSCGLLVYISVSRQVGSR